MWHHHSTIKLRIHNLQLAIPVHPKAQPKNGPPQERQLLIQKQKIHQHPPPQPPTPRWRRGHSPLSPPLQSRMLGPRALRSEAMLRQAPHALRADARAANRAKVRRRRHLVGRVQQRRRRGLLKLTLTVTGPQAQRQAHHLASR